MQYIEAVKNKIYKYSTYTVYSPAGLYHIVYPQDVNMNLMELN